MIDLSCLCRQDIIAHGISFSALLGTPLDRLRWGGSCLSVLKLRGQVTEQAMRRFALGQDFDGIQQLWEGAAHYESAAGYRVGFACRRDLSMSWRWLTRNNATCCGSPTFEPLDVRCCRWHANGITRCCLSRPIAWGGRLDASLAVRHRLRPRRNLGAPD